ncbi:MAG: single-stranded DNA-binding protein, partial [Microgenomates group bacterium]
TFGLATNRTWVTETGEKREETEFHRLVAWNKLAELCSQLLFKGRKVYVEGRLQTRRWTAPDGSLRQTTEIIINDMMILDSKRAPEEVGETVPEEPAVGEEVPAEEAPEATEPVGSEPTSPATDDKTSGEKKEEAKEEEVKAEDIPF